MEYTSIYKNGRPVYFFIKADKPEEWNFIQPYFLCTNIDKPRCGNILEMECLFSGSVWYGRQRHGYGYSASHDVYGQLISCIDKLHGGKLSETARSELHGLNIDDNRQTISAETLAELAALNVAALDEKYNR